MDTVTASRATGSPAADIRSAGDWRGNAFDPACPTRLVLDRISGKWTVLIVAALAEHPLRFGELRDRIGGATAKVLTSTLRSMERDGFVTRTVLAQVPPRVDYALTPLGRSLGGTLDVIRDWAEANAAEIVGHRDRFDTSRESG